jgi:transposase InsO family protein
MWHIDTTVIRLLDGTRAYLHAVIDNFSRRILAWQVADTFALVNSVTVLLDASRAGGAFRHRAGRAARGAGGGASRAPVRDGTEVDSDF